ncbi:hypothetical protein RBB50_007634 [Rhinocladiella similis]
MYLRSSHAFELCGTNGTVVFADNTFHINQIMNTTTNLLNCNVETPRRSDLVDQRTILAVSQHYRRVSKSAHLLALWRDQRGLFEAWEAILTATQRPPADPITITFYNSTNLYVGGLSIIQPQFWATFVSYSQNVTMVNMHVNATSNLTNGAPSTPMDSTVGIPATSFCGIGPSRQVFPKITLPFSSK